MDSEAAGGVTALRMILGRQLQDLREKAGLTYEQAAEAIYASHWTIRRMERGESLKLNSVKGLLARYGVHGDDIDVFLELARDAGRRGWWHTYGDVLPTWFRSYVGLEESASLIRPYEPQSVPGLLQTPDYARALTRAGFPRGSDEEVERRVALRTGRQALLTRPEPPRLWAVIEEAALRRHVGGTTVMRAQLDRLLDACALPNVTLQILPLAGDAHAAMYGPFTLLRFPVPELPDLVYGENMTSAFYLDKPGDVAAYLETIDRICADAPPAHLTPDIISAIREET